MGHQQVGHFTEILKGDSKKTAEEIAKLTSNLAFASLEDQQKIYGHTEKMVYKVNF